MTAAERVLEGLTPEQRAKVDSLRKQGWTLSSALLQLGPQIWSGAPWGLAPGARVRRAAEDAGTVVEAVSDRVRVEWDHKAGLRRPLEWLPLALVKLAPEAPEALAEEPES